jgi:hypothetical protein
MSTNLVKTAPFTLKMLEMMKRPENLTSDGKFPLLSWSPDGNNVILREPKHFGQTLLPLYFKHTNYLSFIRQLNGHGFRKNEDVPVPNEELGIWVPEYKMTPEMKIVAESHSTLKYTNDYFKRDHPENYYLVQREHSKSHKKLVDAGLIKIDDLLTARKTDSTNKRKHTSRGLSQDLHYKPEYIESNVEVYKNYKTQILQSSAEIKTVLDKVKEENKRLQQEQNLLDGSMDSTTHSMRYLCYLLIQMVKTGDRSPALLNQVEEIKSELCNELEDWTCDDDDTECIDLREQVKEECIACPDEEAEKQNEKTASKPVVINKIQKQSSVGMNSPNSSSDSSVPSSVPSPLGNSIVQKDALAHKISDVTDSLNDVLSDQELGILVSVIGENDMCKCPCEAVKRLKIENTLEVENFNEWEKRFMVKAGPNGESGPLFDPSETFEGLNL